jgi:hypothetical protein
MSAAVFAATAPAAPFVAGAVDFEPVEPLGTNGGVPVLVPVFLTTEVGPVVFVVGIVVFVVGVVVFVVGVVVFVTGVVVLVTGVVVFVTGVVVFVTGVVVFVTGVVVFVVGVVVFVTGAVVFVVGVVVFVDPVLLVNLSIANLVPAPRAAPANALVNLLPTFEPLVFVPVVPVVFAPVTLAAPVPAEVKVLPAVPAVLEDNPGILEVVLGVEPFRADVTAVLG